MGGFLATMLELQLKIEQAFHSEIGKTPLRPGNSSVGKGGSKQWRGSCNLISQYFRDNSRRFIFIGRDWDESDFWRQKKPGPDVKKTCWRQAAEIL
jgi:hypothetical protein